MLLPTAIIFKGVHFECPFCKQQYGWRVWSSVPPYMDSNPATKGTLKNEKVIIEYVCQYCGETLLPYKKNHTLTEYMEFPIEILTKDLASAIEKICMANSL